MVDTRKKKILLVDDDEDDFMLLRDIFKEFHPQLEMSWIKDGEEALAYLKANKLNAEKMPLLILLDLNMPKLNGREVLAQIRKEKEIKHIPVVVLSNSMSRIEALESYSLGVNSFVRKPSGYRELREFVQIFYKYWFEYSTLI